MSMHATLVIKYIGKPSWMTSYFYNLSKYFSCTVCVTSEIEDCIEYSDADTCVLCGNDKYPAVGGGSCVGEWFYAGLIILCKES